MSFLSPERLWLLVAVLAIAGVYIGLQLRRRAYAVRFTNLDLLDSVAPKRPGWRRHVPAALFLAAMSSLVVAFAEPVREVQVPREQATVIMAIDTSISMQATDVDPSRIDAAKEAANSFIDSLPEEVNLGLVSFDGSAIVQVTPTTDHEAVRNTVQSLELSTATAIGDAIMAALDAAAAAPEAANGEPVPASVVLMSDGETTVGTPNEQAAAAAAEQEIPVSTIAYGTDDGVIEIPDEGMIPVPVNRDALEEIAAATGGNFFTAASGEELSAVYEDIGLAVGYETETQEVGTWFVGLGLVFLLATAGGSLVWFSRLP